jgi:hypothetical protein
MNDPPTHAPQLGLLLVRLGRLFTTDSGYLSTYETLRTHASLI